MVLQKIYSLMLNKLKQVIELTLTTAFALTGAKWTNFNVLQGVHGVYGVQEVQDECLDI